MKIFITLIFTLILSTGILAQTFINFSQFHLNKTLFNPAAAGMDGKVNASLFARREWVTFPGSPQSNIVLADMPINYERMGIGIRLGQQSLVANNNFEGHLMYSYKINMAKGKLAFGMNIGFQQYHFNSSKLAIFDEDDQMLASKQNALFPDLGCGLVYYKKQFYLGLSALGLFKHPNNSFISENSNPYRRKSFVLNCSNTWFMNSSLGLQTSILANYETGRSPHANISCIGNYKKELFFGGNLKSNKSVALILGVKLDKLSASLENVCLGYSYDVNFSELNKYLNNTHEVTLNINFDKPKSLRKEKQKPEEISPYNL